MAAVVKHLETGGEGVQARITKATLGSGKKLPVLAPRFRGRMSESPNATAGYGGATFWPVGWGKSPQELPTHAMNYRKSTEPLRYRRRDEWRQRRQTTDLDAYVAAAEGMTLPGDLPLLATLQVRPLAKAVSEGGDGDLFDRIGSQFLALTAVAPGQVVLQVPFANLAERLHLLLEAYLRKHKKAFRLIPLAASGTRKSRDGKKSVQVTTSTPQIVGPALQVQLDVHTVDGSAAEDEFDWGALRFAEVSAPVEDGLTVAAE
jgi:hypothetical protein